MTLRGSLDHVAGRPVLVLEGDADLATVATLRDLLLRAVAEHPGQPLVVDLDGVGALDDVGIGVLLGVAGRTRQAGGDLLLVCADAARRERFALTRLDRAVDVIAHLA